MFFGFFGREVATGGRKGDRGGQGGLNLSRERDKRRPKMAATGDKCPNDGTNGHRFFLINVIDRVMDR